MAEVHALVGLGSNDDARRQLARARGALAATLRVVALSEERESAASAGGLGVYRNQLARIATELGPEALRAHLKALEAALGRTRAGDGRVAIDLDLLAYGDAPESPELRAAPYWSTLLPTLP